MMRLQLPGGTMTTPDRRLAGGERLMLALIGTLVDDLGGTDSRLRTEVRRYLLRHDASEPFGFGSICSHFGWSEPRVRQELMKIGGRARHPHRWRSYAG